MQRQAVGREFTFVKELAQVLAPDIYHEGEVKGFRDGEVKGAHDGEVKAIRETIFRLAQRRNVVLSDQQLERIRVCNDRTTLDRWCDNVIDAQTGDDIFR